MSAVAAVLLAAIVASFWVSLGGVARTDRRLAAGEAVGAEERLAARTSLSGIPIRIIVFNLLGFVLTPVVTIVIGSITGKFARSGAESVIQVLFNIALGMSAALMELFLVEWVLTPLKVRLGITGTSGLRRDLSVSAKFQLIALTATALALILAITAGYGFIKEIGRTGGIGEELVGRFFFDTGLLALAVLAWAFSLVRVVARNFREQTELLRGRLEGMAESGGDLTARAPIIQNDEIGALTGAANAFVAALHGMVGDIRAVSEALDASAATLSDAMVRADAAATGLRSGVGGMKRATARQAEAVQQARGRIGAMEDAVAVVTAQLGTQAGNVDESSASVAEMAANTQNVTRLTEQAAAVSRALLETSGEGERATAATRTAMDGIAAASAAVGETIRVIQRISSQTNLLAMNAAIEAAHAGAAGAGFAVVADEVRGLAESSATGARDVVRLIKEMGQKIRDGVATAEGVSTAFSRIAASVAESNQLVATIAASMEEQQSAANEILSSMQSLVDATRTIRSAAEGQHEQARLTTEAIAAIVEGSDEISREIERDEAATAELDAAACRVGEEARGNAAAVERLRALVARFKTD